MSGGRALGVDGSAAYFNRVADGYWARYLENTPGGHAFRARKQRLIEMLDGVTGTVLDVGCGPGVLVQELSDRGCRVWALDAAPEVIAQCRARFQQLPNVHCCIGSATALAFPEGRFDAVICLGVIDRIRDYEQAVSELLRVLKPGGMLFLSFPNLHSPYAVWRAFVFYPVVHALQALRALLTRRPPPPRLPSFVKLHRERQARRLIGAGGGESERATYFNFNLLLSPLDDWFPRPAVWLARRLERHHSGRLKWLGSGFIIQASKRAAC